MKWKSGKRKLGELKPMKGNPRQATEKQVKDLTASLERFDLADPIIINKDNTIIGGHFRHWLLINKYSKDKEVGVRVPGKKLSRKQMEELNIRLNKNLGEWDYDLLANFDEDLLENVGFSSEELDDVFDLDLDDDIDEVPEVGEGEPESKRGEVYQLGKHRLMCGNATKKKDVEKLMGGEKADMVFTDPPYGVDYQSNMREKSDKFNKLKNDNEFIFGWLEWVKKYSNGFIFIWTTWKVINVWFTWVSEYWDITNLIIWDKGGGGIGDLKKTFLTDYEMALVCNRGNEIKNKRIGSVWDIGKDNPRKYKHPTQKPVELSARAIKNSSKRKDIVLDLFGGSGSTLIAAEKLNRKCYMMEIDEHYCDVIKKRYEQYKEKKS